MIGKIGNVCPGELNLEGPLWQPSNISRAVLVVLERVLCGENMESDFHSMLEISPSPHMPSQNNYLISCHLCKV